MNEHRCRKCEEKLIWDHTHGIACPECDLNPNKQGLNYESEAERDLRAYRLRQHNEYVARKVMPSQSSNRDDETDGLKAALMTLEQDYATDHESLNKRLKCIERWMLDSEYEERISKLEDAHWAPGKGHHE